jgi:CRP-like cAMP-binding protein
MTNINRTHTCAGRSNCQACPLRETMICADVSLEDLVSFHTPIDDVIFEPGATLYNMATPAGNVHCIRRGAVKLVRFDAGGVQHIVRILKKNDVAGLESIFLDSHQHTAVALTEVHSCRIPMTHFRRFIDEHPSLQMRLLEKAHEALREADSWLSELVSNAVPARVRLARLLLRLRIGDGDHIYRLNLADMAAILGITPETISRMLGEFRDEGILLKVAQTRNGGKLVGRHYRGNMATLAAISNE